MKQIDELIADKIMEMAHYVLSKLIKPDMTVNQVGELTVSEIERLKQQYGIEGIIVDVDDTLRTEMKKLPKCNREWIESLKGRIKITILSNGRDSSVEEYFQSHEIDYIGFARKPLKRNFLKACEKMNLTPDQVLVVGNGLLPDIYGGKRVNMKTVLVKQVEDDERE